MGAQGPSTPLGTAPDDTPPPGPGPRTPPGTPPDSDDPEEEQDMCSERDRRRRSEDSSQLIGSAREADGRHSDASRGGGTPRVGHRRRAGSPPSDKHQSSNKNLRYM